MAITRWNPMRELMGMHDQLSRFFDDYWTRPGERETDYGTWAPAVDLREEDKRYVIEADMPGVKKEDIEINLENNVLSIRGERKFKGEVNKDTYHRIERGYGKFVRSFTLPARVAADRITATHKDGILEVVVPKAEESLPKKIEVKG